MADRLSQALPGDHASGQFIGRAQGPRGPCVIAVREGRIFDLTGVVATSAGAMARRVFEGGEQIGTVETGLPEGWALLSPIDLQCVKAAGVTFALSAIERVIEERARGDAAAAVSIRAALEDKVGAGIRAVVPGTPEAAELKADHASLALQASIYLLEITVCRIRMWPLEPLKRNSQVRRSRSRHLR